MVPDFSKKETHIVLEELDSPYVYAEDSLFRLTVFSVDEDNNIHIKKDEFFDDFEYFAGSGFFGESVILALSSRNAKTIEASFSIERHNPNTPMNAGELDHLTFKTLWGFLNRYRNWAFTLLGISDFDMVLAGIEITEANIDDHGVVHPLGLKGRNLNLRLRGTFVPRNALPIIERVGTMGENYIIVERLSAISGLVKNCDIAVYPEGDATSIFSRKTGEVKFLENSSWGINPVMEEISRMFFSSPKEALQIFKMYCSGDTSLRLKSAIADKIEGHFNNFPKAIKRTGTNEKIKINASELIYPRLSKGMKGVDRVDFVEILEDKGFHVRINGDGNDSQINMHSEPLALLALSLFMPRYETMNSNLHRRAGWLMATGK